MHREGLLAQATGDAANAALPKTATTSAAANDASATAHEAAADTLGLDTAASDSVAGEAMYGLVFEDPATAYMKAQEARDSQVEFQGSAMSWVYLALAVLFCVVGIKFKGSSRYVKALLADMTDTRVRHNAFDDTVKESSLLGLLNVMWVACGGVFLWMLLRATGAITPIQAATGSQMAKGIGICMGVCGVYLLGMMLAYEMVGNVFSDSKHTKVWVKGAAASYGLEAVLMFPLVLLGLGYPEWSGTLLIITGVVIGIGKIVFLYKGFRIFFTQMSSWMLFLYYLCSLEIIPLVLVYVGGLAASSSWL